MSTIGSNPPGNSGDGVREAARNFEAYFLRQILSEVRPAATSMGSSAAATTFQEMFEDALADSMAQTGQIGLAQALERQLGASDSSLATAAATESTAELASEPTISLEDLMPPLK